MSTATAEDLVTTGEVARRTGLPRRTICDLVDKGVLSAYQPGGRKYYFKWSEVASALERSRTTPHPESHQ